MAKFKIEVLEIMKNDPELFIMLAKAMDIQPGSVKMAIERNGKRLNQFNIVKMVAEYLKKEPEELLDEEPSEVKEPQN